MDLRPALRFDILYRSAAGADDSACDAQSGELERHTGLLTVVLRVAAQAKPHEGETQSSYVMRGLGQA